jgi:formylglycine-generating enzyme required for sulfatase activity
MSTDDNQSLGDGATFAGQAKRRLSAEISLGDEQTLGGGGDAAGLDTVINDIEVVDLEARYKVEGTLGQGGMGAVLLATDTRLERKVAIKRILGEAAGNRIAVQRFLTEAKSIAALNHPNIVQIYDYGRAKDGPFLIMEYVDGGSLLDRCRESAIPLEEAIDLACHLCDGLAKAHDLGIVHRDIKPANVLLTRDGIPKLTDFGLAKATAGDHGQTMTGAVLGTPDFMPPEQRRDASLVDHRSDLWSLAATVYQMATGRSPKIIRFDLLPGELTKVLGKALEDAKDARYQSARELRDALKTSLRAAVAVSEELEQGQCPSCGVKNDASRRFCRGCGDSLEAPCLSCAKPMPMWEEICGSCGSKQAPLIEERRHVIAAKQAEAEGLLGDCEFDRAAAIATQMRDESHPKLTFLSGWAGTFLSQIESSRTEQTRAAVEAIIEAEKHEAAHDYLSARTAIEALPAALQASILPGVRESGAAILERVTNKQAESRRLEGLIKERLAAKQLDELLPVVERLLTLVPDRKDVHKLRGQLVDRRARQEAARDEAVAAAEASLAAHDYERAQAALATIAAAAVTPSVIQLRERAEGLVLQVRSLSKQIKERVAGKSLDGLLPVVVKYLKLKPEDADAHTLRKSLEQREEKIAGEIATRFQQAYDLQAACRFDEAAQLLRAVPEARRSPEIEESLDQATSLAALRGPALRALSAAAAGGYVEALSASDRYCRALTAANITDPECASLVAKAEAAQEQEDRTRRILYITAATAAGIVVLITLAGAGWWIRSAWRTSKVAAAIAQNRWEDALRIEPDNPAALVGRAAARLAASPADIEGAFADLDRAERQPGAAEKVKPVRAEALASRAIQHVSAKRLDQAATDWRAATAAGADAQLLSRVQATIAGGWLAYGEQAVAKNDAAALRVAANAALVAGAEPAAVLGMWRPYASGKIQTLDTAGLKWACTEAKKVGLTNQEEAGWWIQFGEAAASSPHGNVMKVTEAVEAALATGLEESAVASLRARGFSLDALSMQSKGDTREAVAAILQASHLDSEYVTQALKQPTYAAIREGLIAEYRSRFDEAVVTSDWTAAMKTVEVAAAIDSAASTWLAVASARMPPEKLAALPARELAALPPVVLMTLPPEKIIDLPPIRNSIGIELKLLPAGRSLMGGNGSVTEPPRRQVTLTRPFFIGTCETTNAQWQRVMGDLPSKWRDGERPVESVSWEDAVTFCDRLSAIPDEKAAGRVYRLPTAAEWEYACRAGKTTSFACGNILSGADWPKLEPYAWFRVNEVNNAGDQTHPVQKKRPNGWGLYDMHGNVAEWCSDWYGKTKNGGQETDPHGPIGGVSRIAKGGSWQLCAPGSFLSAEQALGYHPSARESMLGFRVVMTPAEGHSKPGRGE